MKFCKDCKHYRTDLSIRVSAYGGGERMDIAAPACDLMSRSPVSGAYRAAWACDEARNDYPGYCGADARFFEPLLVKGAENWMSAR